MAERELSVVISARDEASKVIEKVAQKTKQFANQHTQAMSLVQQASQKAGAALNYYKTHITQVGTVAGGILAGLGALGTSFVNVASATEQNRVAFQTMLGSADKARKALSDLSDFAAETPFALPQVVEGAKRLLAYNVSSEKLIPTFKMLGDVAAGLGKEKLDPLITAFGQVQAKGRLMGQELLQFREAGFDLAKALGVTNEQLEDMVSREEVKFDDVEKAFQKATSSSGLFYDLMNKQSKTFGGTLSNIQDNFTRFAGEVVGIGKDGDIREGSIFYYLKIGAEEVRKKLEEIRPQLVAFIDQLVKNKGVIFAIAGALGALAIAAGIAAVSFLWPAIAVAALGAAIGYEVYRMYEAWNTNFLGIRDITLGVISFFQTLPQTLGNIVAGIIAWFQQLPDRIGAFFSDLFLQKIPYAVGYAAGWLSVKIPEIVGNVLKWFGELPGKVGQTFTNVGNSINTKISSTASWLWNEISQWPQKTSDYISSIPQKVADVFEQAKQWINTKMEEAWKIVTGWWDKIKEVFGWIVEKGNQAWEATKKGFEAGQQLGMGVKKYADGGYVPTTGLAYLHSGEYVLSRDMLAGRQSIAAPVYNTTSTTPISIGPVYMQGSSDVDSLAQRLAFYMKTKGNI